MPEAKADYHIVPTVVFSHPTIATVGYTEQVLLDPPRLQWDSFNKLCIIRAVQKFLYLQDAVAKFGGENLKIYTSSFVNLWYGPFYEVIITHKYYTSPPVNYL